MAKQLNVNLAFNADTTRASKELQNLQKQFDSLFQSMAKRSGTFNVSEEIHKASSDALELQRNIEKAVNVDTGKLNVSELSRNFAKSGKTLEDYRQSLSKLGAEGNQAFSSLAKSILAAEVPLKRTNSLLAEFGTTLKNTARWQISSSLLHGFMGSVQSAYHYAEDLNRSLNNIRIVTGYNVDEMSKFAGEANKAAQALSTTTTAYTDAALIYYQQGLKGEDVTERVNTTIKLANVTRQSAEEVSSQMTAIWNNFAEGSDNLEHYADVITALGAHTASSSAEIAEGLQKFAAVADTVGLSYEYATAALATVTATTRQSADIVGNAFKTLFSRLEGLKLGETLDDGTDLNKYSAALEAVGVSIKDASGQLKAMDTILDELGEKWVTLSNDQQMALAQTVGGVRQYTQLIALMNSYDKFKENVGIAQESDGTLKKQAETYAESWEAAQKKVQAALEHIYSQLINDDFFIDLNNGFAELLKIISNVIDGLGGLKGVLLGIGTIVTSVFGESLANSINNIFMTPEQNLKIWATEQQKALAGLQQNAADQGMVEAADGWTNVATVTDELISNYKNLTAEQQEQVKLELELLKTRAENIESYEREAKSLAKIIEETKQRQNLNKDKLQKATANKEDILNSSNKPLTSKISAAIDNYTKYSRAAKTHGEEIRNASNEYKNLEKALGSYNIKASELADSIDTESEALKELNNDEQQILNTQNKLNEAKTRALELEQDQAGHSDKVVGDIREPEDNSKNPPITLEEQFKNIDGVGQNVIQLSHGLMSVAMGLTAIKNLGNVWADQERSLGDKLLSSVTALGMALPMLINGISTVRTAFAALPMTIAKVSYALGGEAAVSHLVAAGNVTLSGSFLALGKAILGATVPLLGFQVPLLAIAAVIGAVVGAIALLNMAYNADADAAKKAQEAAEDLSKAYKDTKKSYDDLKKSLEDYNSAKTALDALTEGTQEWKDAVIELNEQVLALLDKYPELAQYIDSINGVLTINSKGQQEVINKQQERVQQAYRANIVGQSKADIAQYKSDVTDFSRKIGTESETNLPVSNEAINKAVDAINTQGNAILQNSETLKETAGINKYEADALIQNKTELIKLANQLKTNTKSNELYAEQIGKSIKPTKEGDKQSERLAKLLGNKTLQEFKSLDASALNDSEAREQYARMMGYNYKREDKDNKDQSQYSNDGKTWTSISNEAAKSAIMAEKAQKIASQSTEKYTKALEELSQSYSGLSDAALDVILGLDTGVENLTKEDIKKLEKFNKGGTWDDTQNALIKSGGFDKIKDTITDNYNNAIEDIKNSINDVNLKGNWDNTALSQLSVNAQKGFIKIFNNLSEETAKFSNEVLQSGDLKKIEEVGKSLNNIKENTSVDQFKKQLKELGISTDLTDEEFKQLITQMNNVTKTAKELGSSFGEVEGIISKIRDGATSISEEDYKKLGGDLYKDYFMVMSDGNYKLISDAEAFYNMVHKNKVDELEKNAADAMNKANAINGYQESGGELKDLEGSYNIEGIYQGTKGRYDDKGIYQGDEEVSKRLKLLQDLGLAEEQEIGRWEELNNKGQLVLADISQINEKIASINPESLNVESEKTSEMLASTAENVKDLQQMLDEGKISVEAFNKAYSAMTEALDDDVNTEEFRALKDYIEDNVDSIEGLDQEVINNEESLNDLTEALLRYDHALEEVQKNLDNWKELLASDNIQDHAKAVEELADVYADLFNLSSEDSLSDKFLADTSNLELLRQAAEGSVEAYEQLQQLAGEDILAQVGIDSSRFEEDKAYIEQELLDFTNQDFGSLQVGAELNNEGFLQRLTDLVNAAEMTADQASAYLSSLGIDAKIDTHQVDNKTTRTYNDMVPDITYKDASIPVVAGDGSVTTESTKIPSVVYKAIPHKVEENNPGSGFTLEVTSAKKSSGGNFKFNNTSHGGGSAGRSARSGGGSKGGGGGGSKGSEKKLEVKEHKKDEKDRYWDINNSIKSVENSLGHLDKTMKKLDTQQGHYYGKALIASLQNQNELIKEQDKLLNKQKKNYKDLYKEQQKELGELKGKLEAAGGEFKGNVLNNYAAVLDKARAEYDAVVDAYNASAQEDEDKDALDKAEKAYEEVKKNIDRYKTLYYNEMDDTKAKLEDIEQQTLENRFKKLENNLKAWDLKIELKLETTEAKRKWNEFLRKVQQDFKKAYKNLSIETKYNQSNFETQQTDIQTTKTAISDVEKEIRKLQNGKKSSMFDNISEAQEKLKELQKQLIEQGEALTDTYEQTWETYLEGLDQAADKFEDLMDEYERINDELEYQKELQELLYGEEAYDKMAEYYNTALASNESQVKSLEQQVTYWNNQFDESLKLAEKQGEMIDLNDKSTWTKDMVKAYDEANKAQSSLNDKILEGAKLLKDQYLNSVKQITAEMEKKVWGQGFDKVKANWDFMQRKADEYLNDTEAAYRIQTLSNKINKSISETSSLAAQQKLEKLREKELQELHQKKNLTQADVDLAEARYQIALKEIALEDAQNNKTSMKLTRDESGNWTYQYVADEEDMRTKQQDLLDAYNSLYETANNAYNHSIELAMNLYEEMLNEIDDFANHTTLKGEDLANAIKEIEDKYLDEMMIATEKAEDYKVEVNASSVGTMLQSYETLTDNQKRLVDEVKDKHLQDYKAIRDEAKNETFPDIADAAKTAAGEIVDKWSNDPESVKNIISKAFKDITKVTKTYHNNLETKYVPKVTKGYEKIADKINIADDKTQNLLDTSEGLDDLRSAIEEMNSAWEETVQSIESAINALQEYLALETEVAAIKNQPSDPNVPSTPYNGGDNPSYSTDGSEGQGVQNNPGGEGSGNGGGNGNNEYEVYDSYHGGIKITDSDWKRSIYDMSEEERKRKGYSIVRLASGGYTGSWDDTGRLAVLHQKELVLNQDDTANMLQAVSAIRDIAKLDDSINSAIASSIGAMAMNIVANSGAGINTNNNNSNANNQFNITAEFPNANDVNSIREAILSLPNLASQYIHQS